MKKIININLSGRVIPIEDTAYEKLQNYIESLRRYFANEEGRDEIINDIESRVAELMNEKIRKGANAITDADMEEIISSMGRTEDFEAADLRDEAGGSQKNSGSAGSYTEPKMRTRLYRDANDKVIGGVCAGLANYLNVDPAIIRLLFAIITFGGFGFGVLAYILMWIILPEERLETYSGRRLYRNPDDKIIAGVAGGIAAYFNKDSKIIRLIFVAPLLLNILIGILSIPFFSLGAVLPTVAFGSLTGTFVLVYIIMWIVLPEANTEYQKMEMRGEKVDVNRIRQNVQDRAKEFGAEVKTAAQHFGQKVSAYSKERGRTFAKEVNEAAKKSCSGFGHAIGVLFKVFFFFIAGSIAFGLFVALVALFFGGVAWWPINKFLWTSEWQKLFAWGTVLFFLAVPLIAFITWLVRRIMRVRSGRGYLGWTFGALWFLGWVSVVLLAASLTRDFRSYEEDRNDITINQPAGKLTVGVTRPGLMYSGGFNWLSDEPDGWDISDDTLRLSWVNIDVTKSADSSYHVIVWKNSWGKNDAVARNRAESIVYEVSYANNYLDLGSGYAIDKEHKFRGQHIVVEIQVPVGKKIRFDQTINEKLNNVEIEINDRHDWRKNRYRRGIHIRDYDFRWNTEVDYVMGEDGILYNPDKPAGRNTENYRYEKKNDEIRKKELQEELRQIEERQKKDSLSKQSQSQKESMDDIQDETTESGFGSLVFSMVKFIY